jgi:hypothetical protein
MFRIPFRLLSILGGLVLAFGLVLPAAAYHTGDTEHPHPFGSTAFETTWARTDKPVADGAVSRTWMWGPSPYSPMMTERSDNSPGGIRMVQYFDKARMEISQPGADQDSLWYVTNGLLVNEMIHGHYQVDADTWVETSPADIPVAGDPDDADSPTYASLGHVLIAPAATDGAAITQRIAHDGTVTNDTSLASRGVTAAYHVTVPGLDHQVASVFWQFMNSSGIVYENGATTTDALFENPFYATGYPVTEAYWANVNVAGAPHDVLLQCFERRCLTYTPDNPDGWKVEAGNVGQHYYKWRYGASGPATEQANIYLVAIGDNGASGTAFGCEDSLIPVTVDIDAHNTTEAKITAALTALFAIDDQYYGESGLYNVFYQSDLAVNSISIENGVATVDLTGDMALGGECDDPRVEQTIRATILQFPEVTDAVVTRNGQPLVSLSGM